MKTTIELSDDLASRAKAYAARQGITLRAVVEQGIRQVLSEDRRRPGFQLRDASVGGKGMQPEFQDGDWSKIRAAIYEGYGG